MDGFSPLQVYVVTFAPTVPPSWKVLPSEEHSMTKPSSSVDPSPHANNTWLLDAVVEQAPEQSQQAILRNLGDARVKELVARYVDAWHSGSIDQLMAMLTEDAVIAMPPRPTWFRG